MNARKYVFDVVLCTGNRRRMGYRLRAANAAEAASKAMMAAMRRLPALRPAALELVELKRLRAVRRNLGSEAAARGVISTVRTAFAALDLERMGHGIPGLS